MKSIVKNSILAVITVVSFVSCQELFTNSVFSFVEIEMSSMSDDQKISYAEDLLATGSETELEAAYAEISEMLDGVDLGATDLSASELELVTLGADLAIGASGVGDAVTTAINTFVSGDGAEDPAAVADSIIVGFDDADYQSLEEAVELIKVAEKNKADLTPQQYMNASTAMLLVVLNDVEDLNIESPDQLDSSIEEQAKIIEDLEKALAWAEAGGLDSSLFGDGIAVPVS